MVKRYASDIDNTCSYNLAVLRRILSHQLWSVTADGAFIESVCLIKPRQAPAKLDSFVRSVFGLEGGSVMTSWTAFKPPFTNCACNDMVLIRSIDGTNYIAGQILSLFAIDSIGTFCLVNMFEFAGQDADFHSHWRNANQHMIINVSSLLASTVWTKLRDARFRLLTPLHFKGAKAVAT